MAPAVAQRAERRHGRPVDVSPTGRSSRRRRRRSSGPISNLVDNAAKFDAARGPIEIEVAGGRLSCTTAARASPTPTCRRIFDRFYRAEGARVAARLGARPVDRPRGRRARRRPCRAARARAAARGRLHAAAGDSRVRRWRRGATRPADHLGRPCRRLGRPRRRRRPPPTTRHGLHPSTCGRRPGGATGPLPPRGGRSARVRHRYGPPS